MKDQAFPCHLVVCAFSKSAESSGFTQRVPGTPKIKDSFVAGTRENVVFRLLASDALRQQVMDFAGHFYGSSFIVLRRARVQMNCALRRVDLADLQIQEFAAAKPKRVS